MKGVDAQRLAQGLGGLIIELLILITNKWVLGATTPVVCLSWRNTKLSRGSIAIALHCIK